MDRTVGLALLLMFLIGAPIVNDIYDRGIHNVIDVVLVTIADLLVAIPVGVFLLLLIARFIMGVEISSIPYIGINGELR